MKPSVYFSETDCDFRKTQLSSLVYPITQSCLTTQLYIPFPKIAVDVIAFHYKRKNLKIIPHACYKSFSQELFDIELSSELSKTCINNVEFSKSYNLLFLSSR